MSTDMMSVDMSIDGCSKRKVPQKVSHLKYIPFLILIMSYVMVFIYNFSSVSNIFWHSKDVLNMCTTRSSDIHST